MRKVILDLETKSDVDINLGPHKYASSAEFDIILLGLKWSDSHAVRDYDDPRDIKEVLQDVAIAKAEVVAHNLNWFDRIMLERWSQREFGRNIFTDVTWNDTQERARISQEPKLSLDDLSSKYGSHKDSAGHDLIRLFSMPHKVTKSEAEEIGDLSLAGKTMWVTKDMMPRKWLEFRKYLIQDVVAEEVLDKALPELNEFERKVSEVTYQINAHGSRLNLGLTHAMLKQREANNIEMKSQTEINTGSTKQMKEAAEASGYPLETTRAPYLKEVLGDPKLPDELRKLIEIRLITNLSALKKLDKEVKGEIDGYIYDYLVYAGATASGRWSGKGIQLQNLTHDAPNEKAGETYTTLANDLLDNRIENKALAKLVRPTLIPDEGDLYVILDFSNIEARVQAWISGDEHMQHAFREGLDVYRMTATKMYNVPYEDTIPYRKDAKTATLALGYGGGVNSLQAFGYKGEDPEGVVKAWRDSNVPIKRAWSRIMWQAKIDYMKDKTHIDIPLPSGRIIRLHGEELRSDGKGGFDIFVDRGSKSFWKNVYGGMLFNRVVQGFARDLMAEAMVRVAEAGYTITNSVHDEVVITLPKDRAHKEFEKIKAIMLDHGYEGLLLAIDGEVSPFYRK